MNAIIYTTNTGRTERYARQLVQKTGPPGMFLPRLISTQR